ncbi:hypothetical protein SKAU_G00314320 [Synaphobranchus kaupii]|uniref:Uncharacterized protein n=1 Tax=Synaphobranchus kaupii TaxID=118154 RepID=A0A9Q1ESH1_SYNKA|nr:hypothetical protein SKAU_G00314320 [Synaphobranchus kaupii]
MLVTSSLGDSIRVGPSPIPGRACETEVILCLGSPGPNLRTLRVTFHTLLPCGGKRRRNLFVSTAKAPAGGAFPSPMPWASRTKSAAHVTGQSEEPLA